MNPVRLTGPTPPATWTSPASHVGPPARRTPSSLTYAGGMSDDSDREYCLIDATTPPRAEGPPYAECVLCRKPTEYPESYKGITLCPVCEWQEAQRTACSG